MPNRTEKSTSARRFGSVEEIERVFFARLHKERCRTHRLSRELQECDEALTACEEAHGVVVPRAQ